MIFSMASWSLTPPVSTAECMPQTGFPTSTIGMSILDVVMEAMVYPPRLSDLFTKVWVLTPAIFARLLKTAMEFASDV